jgi:hypothetical protein
MTEVATELDRVLEEALKLSEEDQRKLIEMLSAVQPIRPRKSLEQLVAEQGKKPLKYAELRKLGEFFPEDESVDDLVNFIRESRRDRNPRSLE